MWFFFSKNGGISGRNRPLNLHMQRKIRFLVTTWTSADLKPVSETCEESLFFCSWQWFPCSVIPRGCVNPSAKIGFGCWFHEILWKEFANFAQAFVFCFHKLATGLAPWQSQDAIWQVSFFQCCLKVGIRILHPLFWVGPSLVQTPHWAGPPSGTETISRLYPLWCRPPSGLKPLLCWTRPPLLPGPNMAWSRGRVLTAYLAHTQP